MASLKPKLFCGVAFRTKGVIDPSSAQALEQLAFQPSHDACNLRHNICQTTVLKPVGQRLHTDRTNQTLHFTSDCESETGNYKGQGFNCQARTRL